MPNRAAPSSIWSGIPDPPIQQDGSYRLNAVDRAYFDDQIRALATILLGGASGAPLATVGFSLVSNGPGTIPTYQEISGGDGRPLNTLSTSTSSYTLAATTDVLVVNSSGNSVEVQLASPSARALVQIANVVIICPNAAVNNVLVIPHASETINGISYSSGNPYVINTNQAWGYFYTDATNYYGKTLT